MRVTQRKGDIAVSQAIATFTKRGYDVLIPFTESAAYDIAVDINGRIKRVQVKFAGTKEVDLRRIHSNAKGYVIKKSKENSYDWLYIYQKDGKEFLIRKCLAGRRSISLTTEEVISKQGELE